MRCRQRLFDWLQCTKRGDLYVMRNNTDGNYEGVTHFILVEQPGGTYTLNANPTSAQISQFNLNTPAAIAYELADINLDGAMDMVLLDSGNIASGIVYAATSSQSAPIGYKHIDEEFVEFFADLYQGILDPDYFYNTALQNGWGTWEQVGPYIFSYWDSAILHLSGQTFVPVDLPPPSEPIPFYIDVADAYKQHPVPLWCTINGPNGYRWWNGVWEVLGWYREAVFVPDYSYFNEDAMTVAEPISNYLATQTSAVIQTVVFQVLEEILGTSHNLDNEPAIFNLIKRIGQVVFGFGVEQEAEVPTLFARVELVYTNPTSSMGLNVPLARHAYVQVTMPNGTIYVTRGGPEDPPSHGNFGNIDTVSAQDPQSEENFPDYGRLVRFRQLVGFTSLNGPAIWSILQQFSSSINSCAIEYIWYAQNSNSYAFQAVEQVTGYIRPRAQVLAPANNTVLQCP